MKIHIKNGRVIDPSSGLDDKQDVYIAAGRIVAMGRSPDGFHANRVIDADALVVCPGLIDISVRLREPGFEYKATLESELEAAVAGGVTSLACPPDTDPPLDEPGLVEMLKHRARSLNRAHVHPIGALTLGLAGQRITEMAELHEAGCIAFGEATRPIVDTKVLFHALQYAATFGYRVWLYPQDPFLGESGVAHDGEVASRLGLAPIPGCAETVRIATVVQLAAATGARLHVTRLSSAAGLAMIKDARKRGVDVTCDVSINHIHLSEMDVGDFNPNCHLQPPLRTTSDREALRQGLKDGSIDALCSDHTPVDDDAKQLPFAEAEPGATGVELLLPLTLKWATEAGVPLLQALSRVTVDAASMLGVEGGRLCAGGPADVCIFDPAAPLRVSRETLRSQGKNTPFLGFELSGRVRFTLLEGHIVHEAR
jgi:dihydroorotase